MKTKQSLDIDELFKYVDEKAIKKFKETIDYNEFKKKSDLNKRLILDLNEKCEFGENFEVEKILRSNHLDYDYIYKLLFVILDTSNEKPEFDILGFKFESTEQIKTMYYLYNYFSESIYSLNSGLPKLPDIKIFTSPQIDDRTLEFLKSMIKVECEKGYNMEDKIIEPNTILNFLKGALDSKDELKWYLTDKDIEILESIYCKASTFLKNHPELLKKKNDKDVDNQEATEEETTMDYPKINIDDIESNSQEPISKEKEIFHDVISKVWYSATGKKLLYMQKKMIQNLKVDALIYNDDKVNDFANKVVNKYNNIFTQSYKKKISPQQLRFSYDCTRVLSGGFKDNKPVLIPAKAGFGKSTLIRTFLETKINEAKIKDDGWGAVIVTDRIEDLKQLQKYIEDNVGAYKEDKYYDDRGNKKVKLTPWIYVLEGWSESICLNNIKKYDERNCTRTNCPKFERCKVFRQFYEQINSPIVAMSNARLYNYLSENKLKEFVNWEKIDKSKGKRELLLIDEKPKLENTDDIDMRIIEEMITNINQISAYSNENIKSDKKLLKDELVQAQEKIIELMNKHSDDRNAIIYEDKDKFFSSKFIINWNKYYKFRYRYKINAIETLLTKGGLWCNTKNRRYFNILEYINFDWNNSINTVIFDATSESDPSYSEIFNYLDINDYKKYEHLEFKVIDDNFSKNALKEKPEKIKAVTDWIKRDIVDKGKVYAVTYMNYSPIVKEQLKGYDNIVFDIKDDKEIIPYFNNTKGKNTWQDCNQIVHIGWNVYPSDEYIASYLCVFGFDKLHEKYFEFIEDEEARKFLTTGLVKLDGYKFNVPNITFHKFCKIVSDFEQEIFRTKLRDFSSEEEVTAYIFNPDKMLLQMLEQRFTGCKIDKIEVNELLLVSKRKGKNGANNKEVKLSEWLKNWSGEKTEIKQIREELDITGDYWSKLKKRSSLINDIWREKDIHHVQENGKHYIYYD
ncbi:hypothetical protein GOQ27_14340 [Clostridium sp. D2Q-11]|uniref:Uncharacterized protein n=1 Tax=Anaeromonas frigoriresistens TaxID=2683708 RepID=A0A942UXY7_9FIRM|nr:hypothetical protein [Anaeromonas frigoriresistens]MBS4539650.1 hypothetical protein [Anaeromonas frigoriresistens]